MRLVGVISFASIATLAACGQGNGNQLCTTNPDRSKVDCAGTITGPGCSARDLGYADDNTYAVGCIAPRHDDSDTCAKLYFCDVSEGPQWLPDDGY